MLFIVWHDGDRTVGDFGQSAEVKTEIPPEDEELVALAKDALRRAFVEIWDAARVHVATSVELDGDECSRDACPGCGNLPGEGFDSDCDHPGGCGFWREMAAAAEKKEEGDEV